jgi:hypothetical protein
VRKYLLGLLGLALLGGAPALGQTSPGHPVAVANPAPGDCVGAVEECGPTGACCAHTRTECVPEHYCKKKELVLYGSCCRPLCLGYCHGLFGRCACDRDGHCGHVYTQHYLMKRVRICEQDAVKCVPAEVADCDRGRCRGPQAGCCAPACGAVVAHPVVPTAMPAMSGLSPAPGGAPVLSTGPARLGPPAFATSPGQAVTPPGTIYAPAGTWPTAAEPLRSPIPLAPGAPR